MNQEAVERLCNLPLDFLRIGTLSVVDLVARSEYRSASPPITRAEIASYLRCEPDLVAAWQGLSDDQRVTQGWVLQHSKTGWLVYLYPAGECIKFQDQFDACAEFIMRYVARVASKSSS